jgi:hypothetical protein
MLSVGSKELLGLEKDRVVIGMYVLLAQLYKI